MKYWWEKHNDIKWGQYDKEEVEDITGRIPLLLVNCISEEKEIDLRFTQAIWDEILAFAREHRGTYQDKE